MLSDLSALHERLFHVRAIFFDWDGVLADTGEDNYLAWAKSFEKYGIALDRETYFLLEGRKISEIAGIILERNGQDISFAESIALDKDRYYLENSRADLFPGVAQMLEVLKSRGFMLGLVSGAASRRLYRPPAQQIRKLFDVVVSGDDCSNGKPAPDPYLSAAQRVGAVPADCLVVENAPLGIRAAASAGMLCIAVASSLSPEALRQADWIIESTGQLLELLPVRSKAETT